jgi:hypothetical protein
MEKYFSEVNKGQPLHLTEDVTIVEDINDTTKSQWDIPSGKTLTIQGAVTVDSFGVAGNLIIESGAVLNVSFIHTNTYQPSEIGGTIEVKEGGQLNLTSLEAHEQSQIIVDGNFNCKTTRLFGKGGQIICNGDGRVSIYTPETTDVVDKTKLYLWCSTLTMAYILWRKRKILFMK